MALHAFNIDAGAKGNPRQNYQLQGKQRLKYQWYWLVKFLLSKKLSCKLFGISTILQLL
jgi:hypothetical protein